MEKLLIGWAEKTLVHEKKISLYGQFFERISEYVESEITATAMAVESNGEQMILVSADLTAIPDFLMALVREKVASKNSEIDPMKIIISATHTHNSHTLGDPNPSAIDSFETSVEILREFMKEGQDYKPAVSADDTFLTPLEATEFVATQIADATVEAWERRESAYYANEFGRAVVGMCRRVSYTDGTAEMWGDTNTADFTAFEGGNDSGIELIYTFDKNKKLTGVVANIACPSQVLEQRSFISADFWGRAKANVREALGDDVYLLGLGGAGGDQCPRDLVRWVNPETPIDDPNVKRQNLIRRKADSSAYDISGCNKIGKRISNEILSVLSEVTEYKDEAILIHEVRDMELPLRKATKTEYNHAVREIEYFIEKNKDKSDFNFEDNAKLFVHAGLIERYRYQQNTEIVNIESHVVRFGDVAFATSPFELFLDFGNRIKARSYAVQSFIIQLSCGCAGYLPTEKAEKAGHYSAYISSGLVGHEGGDLMVREQLKSINEMFKDN